MRRIRAVAALAGLSFLLGGQFGRGTDARVLIAPSTRVDDVPSGSDLLDAARSGSPLVLRSGVGDLRIVVSRNDVILPDPAQLRGPDGSSYAHEVVPLTGRVLGEEDGWVRLTVSQGAVFGHVYAPSTGLLSVASPRAGRTRVLSSDEVARRAEASGEAMRIEPGRSAAETCDSIFWVPEVASPITLLQPGSERTFDVAFAVDGSYVEQDPTNWATRAVAAVNSVDGIYEAQANIRVSAVHVVAVADADIPGEDTIEILASLQDYYVDNYPALVRDNVHLLTGRGFPNAAGQANCVGSAGRTDVSYTMASTDGEPLDLGVTVWFADKAVKITAHELGHALSAHHHYMNCVETLPTYSVDRSIDACTIMVNDWGLIQARLGSLERLTIRGWADHYDI